MREPAFCMCENKGADQCLCFHYIDSTIQSPTFQASSHLLWLYSPVSVRPGREPGRDRFSHDEADIC